MVDQMYLRYELHQFLKKLPPDQFPSPSTRAAAMRLYLCRISQPITLFSALLSTSPFLICAFLERIFKLLPAPCGTISRSNSHRSPAAKMSSGLPAAAV